MTDNKCCPPPKDVQDFLFKQESIGQICDEFHSIPVASSLIAIDGKRGLLYIGHENKLIVVKPGADSNSQWKLELELPLKACRVELNCDYSLLAVTFAQPVAVIYSASSISKHKLDKLHEIRLSSTAGDISVTDFKWNPAIPDTLCSITSDNTIGCFQVSKDKGIHIIGRERPSNLEALCVSWSPKGKQLVIGCRNGDIIQLKPELKITRHLTGPNPSEGIIISILWVSNYQFCACYFHAQDQRISVMIVDAPKGVTAPKFTNYEDITFGSGSTDGLHYYFEHIAEWGIIIAASTHSSELAVLGTSDNGATWNFWQLMEGSTVQLPLNRKKKTENYPVGIAIDRSPSQKLMWGNDMTLPNPVPILRILVTSGQMCCYHMVNLKENALVICSPPTENVPAPAVPRPSLGPSEVSFNLPSGATSTPQKINNPEVQQVDRTKVPSNMFGDSAGSNFTFPALEQNKGASEPAPQSQMKNVGFAAPAEVKMTGLFGQGDGKGNMFQQANTTNKPFATQPVQQQIKPPMPSVQQPIAQPETKATGFSPKPISKPDSKIISVPVAAQVEPKSTKEPVREQAQPRMDEPKPAAKQMPVYDDGICLQAYYEEQTRFEKELRSKLELPSWSCGTEEERQLLVKKTSEIEEFLKELQETTSSLASDIAYLKALLLQSFAWIEETKSKSSANVSLSGRSRSEGSKLAELQRLYYYTQSQLIQATKVLDLEWSERKNHELSKMKLPRLEIIYQSLIKHNQIITEEKKNLEELIKKWRAIARGGGGGGGQSALASLDRSMAGLNLSQTSCSPFSDTAIDLRCKLIATNTRNFSQEKQMKLRDLLAVTEPKIIPAAKPTAIQDRLQATLSSLASQKATEASAVKAKPSKPAAEAQQAQQQAHKTNALGFPVDSARSKPAANPLSSLDNLVCGIGMGAAPSGLSKSPSSISPFSATSVKPMFATPPPKPKESFASGVAAQPATAAIGKTFSFAGMTQKIPDPQAYKESAVRAPVVSDASVAKFPTFSAPLSGVATGAPAIVTPMPNFNFSSPSLPKVDNASVFKFSTKTSSPMSQQSPAATSSLDLSSLNFGARTATAPAATLATTTPSTFSFGKVSSPTQLQQQQQEPQQQQQQQQQKQPQSSLFGQLSATLSAPVSAAPTSQAAAAAAAVASMTSQLPFGKVPTSGAVTSPEKPAAATSSAAPTSQPTIASTAAPSSIFGTGNTATFGSLTITASPSSTFSPTTATTATVTTTATKTIQQSGASTTPSSTSSFSGLLGATASMSFGTPATTASSGLPSFGNIFGGTTAPTVKVDAPGASANAAATQASTTPFAGSTTTPSTSGNSIFGGTSTTPVSGASSIFGSPTSISAGNSFFSAKSPVSTQPAAGSSIFGSATATSAPSAPSAPSSTSIFGGSSATAPAFASSTTTQPSNVFGASTTKQSSTSSIFGASATTQSSVFGGTTTPSTGGSLFGSGATQTTATPASPAFGTSTTQSSTAGSVFGTSTTQSSTAGSVFGTGTSQSSSLFGGAAAQSAPSFGSTATTATTAGSSIFGSAATVSSPFGASGSSVFGATPGASIFGAPATTSTPSMFGSPAAASTTTTASLFGTPAATTTATGSIFGAATAQPAAGGVFGSAPAAPTSPSSGGSVFGSPGALGAGGGASMFGGAASPSMFGQQAAFGAKSVFGTAQAGFGASGFGSPPAFGATPAQGFGSPSGFGAGAAPADSTSPSKVFGSSTFEALGAQTGGLSFGSLAQGTPPQQEKPQAFQGSSSFSSWR